MGWSGVRFYSYSASTASLAEVNRTKMHVRKLWYCTLLQWMLQKRIPTKSLSIFLYCFYVKPFLKKKNLHIPLVLKSWQKFLKRQKANSHLLLFWQSPMWMPVDMQYTLVKCCSTTSHHGLFNVKKLLIALAIGSCLTRILWLRMSLYHCLFFQLSCTGLANVIIHILHINDWPSNYYAHVFTSYTTLYDQIKLVNPVRFLLLCFRHLIYLFIELALRRVHVLVQSEWELKYTNVFFRSWPYPGGKLTSAKNLFWVAMLAVSILLCANVVPTLAKKHFS